MTEDEEFELLEARLKAKRELEAQTAIVPPHMHDAVVQAQKFVEDNKDELGIFTLRKAFEMGYRIGCIHVLQGKVK